MAEVDPELSMMLDDESFGAGNFLYRFAGSNCARRCRLVLDEPLALDSESIPRTLSVDDILRFADSIATWYADQGVEPKDPVALVFDDNVLYLLHYAALTRLGAISVHINGGLPADVLAAYIRRISARRVVTQRRRQPEIASLLETDSEIRVDCAEAIPLNTPARYRAHRHQPHDPVLIAHTSGTTGTPKAIQHNHAAFFHGVRRQVGRMVASRVLTAMPHSHAASMTVLMLVMLRGCQIKMQSRKAPRDVLASIGEFKPDFFCSFPKIYVDMCRHDLERYDLNSVTCWLSTGDANHESHIRRLMKHGHHERDGERHPGSMFIDNLGFTEFGFSAFRRIHRPGEREISHDRCIGRPYNWIDAAILDDEGEEVGPDQVGKLGVRAECLTAGYWNDSLRTEKNRLGGYWLTGDLAYRTSEGLFYHVDRIQDAIDTGQGALYSCQAEELILKHFAEIFDCSIVGALRPDGTSRAVMTAEVTGDVNPSNLLDRVNARLAKQGIPAVDEVVFADAHSDTGVTGKKLKLVLRNRFSGAVQA